MTQEETILFKQLAAALLVQGEQKRAACKIVRLLGRKGNDRNANKILEIY